MLIKEIESNGIRGYLLFCLSRYLEKRSLFVNVRYSTSANFPLNCEVPQGSDLRPLLFIIPTKVLHHVCQKSKVLHFANDISVLLDLWKNDANIVNCEFDLIIEWMKSNKLTLKQSKT